MRWKKIKCEIEIEIEISNMSDKNKLKTYKENIRNNNKINNNKEQAMSVEYTWSLFLIKSTSICRLAAP